MAKEFNKYFEDNQPSVRIGERVPANAVNLAFLDVPELSPMKNIQIFDYSQTIPENAISIGNFKSDMSIKGSLALGQYQAGLLVSPGGDPTFPVSNVIITNKYLLSDDLSDRPIPLFYSGESIHKHYESNPPVAAGNQNDWRVYRGLNIKVIRNRKETDDAHIIEIKYANIPGVWDIRVMSEFTSTETSQYSLQYTRFISHEGGSNHRYQTNFEEIYKSHPVFDYVGDSSEAILEVMNSNERDDLFASEKIGEEGFKFWVKESPNTDVDEARNPKIFKWRIRATDSNSDRYLPWRSERLFHKESLFLDEYTNHNNEIIYVEDGSIAKKMLISSPREAFNNISNDTKFHLEIMLWDNQWVEDVSQSIKVSIDEDGYLPVYVYTLENTGAINQSNHSIINTQIDHDNITVPISIEAYMTESQLNYTAAVNKNIAVHDLGASVFASSNIDTLYKNRNSLNHAIDGVTMGLGKIFGSIPFLLSFFQNHMWYATSEELLNPPTQDVILTVNLPTEDGVYLDITDVDIILGTRGTVKKVRVLGLGDSLLEETLSVDPVYSDETTRSFKWQLATARKARRIEVTISPSKWLTRTKKPFFLFKWLGAKDKHYYRSGVEVVQVNAWHRTPEDSDPDDWGAKSTYSLEVSRDKPYIRNFADIISEVGLLPPPRITETDKVRYRVMVGDGTTSATKGYNELVTLNFRDAPMGSYVFDDTEGENIPTKLVNTYNQSLHNLTYQQVMQSSSDIYLQARYDHYILQTSSAFAISSLEDSSIYVQPSRDNIEDSMWHLKINNGDFVVIDTDGRIKEYLVTEFNSQPFSSSLGAPYSEVVFEKATFIDDRQLRVSRVPIFVEAENGVPKIENLILYKSSERYKPKHEREIIPVRDWNPFTGDIYLDQVVQFTEDIYADYSYVVTNYEYRGYGEIVSETNPELNKFHYLDLNPLPGHKYTDSDGELRDSAELLDKEIYIYLIPAYILDRSVLNNQAYGESLPEGYIFSAGSNTIKHLIVDTGTPQAEAYSQIYEDHEDALVLAKVLVRNVSTPNSINIIDTRSKGGGYKESLSDKFIKSLSEESEFAWDISSWDGHPYPSNGVVIVTLPKDILESEENPNGFTEEQVKEQIDKYLAYGTYAIVRYE